MYEHPFVPHLGSSYITVAAPFCSEGPTKKKSSCVSLCSSSFLVLLKTLGSTTDTKTTVPDRGVHLLKNVNGNKLICARALAGAAALLLLTALVCSHHPGQTGPRNPVVLRIRLLRNLYHLPSRRRGLCPCPWGGLLALLLEALTPKACWPAA